ncbi:MAG TPA: YlmC/YmxH family sporulation protein [Thermaerobacter sp.]
MLKTSELRARDVINIVDGRRLGWIGDVEIDVETGRIRAIVVPGPARWLGLFGRDRDYVIPWEQIVKFGQDVILVRVPGFVDMEKGAATGRPGVPGR